MEPISFHSAWLYLGLPFVFDVFELAPQKHSMAIVAVFDTATFKQNPINLILPKSIYLHAKESGLWYMKVFKGSTALKGATKAAFVFITYTIAAASLKISSAPNDYLPHWHYSQKHIFCLKKSV